MAAMAPVRARTAPHSSQESIRRPGARVDAREKRVQELESPGFEAAQTGRAPVELTFTL